MIGENGNVLRKRGDKIKASVLLKLFKKNEMLDVR